jgi:HEAT repeat protein
LETEIVPTLIGLLHDEDTSVRKKAAEVFGKISKTTKSDNAVKLLIELLGDPDGYIRTVASRSLLAIDPKEAERVIPVLIEVIHSGDSAGHAADLLAEIKPQGLQLLLAMLDDKNPAVRAVAISTIVRHGKTTPDFGQLKKLLQDEEPKVRGDAVAMISNIRPPTPEAASAILPLLQDKTYFVRNQVLWGLAKLHADPKLALPEMAKLADDEDYGVRGALAQSLRVMGAGAVPTLIKLLDDERPQVRARAADSLGGIGAAAKDALPALKRHLTDMGYTIGPESLVCHRAGDALVLITGDKHYLEGLPRRMRDGL